MQAENMSSRALGFKASIMVCVALTPCRQAAACARSGPMLPATWGGGMTRDLGELADRSVLAKDRASNRYLT